MNSGIGCLLGLLLTILFLLYALPWLIGAAFWSFVRRTLGFDPRRDATGGQAGGFASRSASGAYRPDDGTPHSASAGTHSAGSASGSKKIIPDGEGTYVDFEVIPDEETAR